MKTEFESMSEHFVNRIFCGDCVDIMSELPSESVDFALTDPPYLVDYQPRDGRRVANDDSTGYWLEPSFRHLYRVLRNDSFCVTFYSWKSADRFVSAFRAAGFRPVSHLSFIKRYASYTGFTRARHEVGYVLVKGRPAQPQHPIEDIISWEYTGNKLHPTEKPVSVLTSIIKAFSKPADVVLDPFCGSGSSLVAANESGRRFIGIDIELAHAETAARRLHIRSAANAA